MQRDSCNLQPLFLYLVEPSSQVVMRCTKRKYEERREGNVCDVLQEIAR